MRLLDLFCGAGGAAAGYHRAGFEVVGIDISPQPHYPFLFHQGDALDIDTWLRATDHWSAIDVIHASPPCQFYSGMSHARPGVAQKYPDLIGPARRLLEASGLPWVIENVPDARAWMKDPVLLCAQMFRPGVLLYRHRLFEAGGGLTLTAPPAPAERAPGAIGSCGRSHPVPASRAGHWVPGTAMSVAGHVGNVALAREVMEIGWTTRDELAEAIPPYYAEWVGQRITQAAQTECPDRG
jgi:DNA (cytosine-5)-methyltransferase 1